MLERMSHQSVWSTGTAVAGSVAIAGMVGAHALITVGRGPRLLLLGLMAGVTFAPLLALGSIWPPVAGMLGAAILLTFRALVSWPLFGLAVAADAVIGSLLSDEGPVIFGSRALTSIVVGVALLAVTRLAQLIQQADDARWELARTEANAERLRAARRLRTALGARLSRLIERAREISASDHPSSRALTDLADLTRRASGEAREVVRIHSAAGPSTDPHLPPAPAYADDYQLAWWVSIILVGCYGGIAVTNMIWSGGAGTADWLFVIAALITFSALHLYHGTPRRGAAPRWWRWTLAAQILLVAIVSLLFGRELFLLWILTSGAALARIHPRLSLLVPLPVVGYCFYATYYAIDPVWNWWTMVYFIGTLVTGAITVYALCSLPGMARRLHETRTALARTAIAAERLRFARDVHDLLGFHLSAAAFKAELAARIRESAPAAVQEHLSDITRSAGQALAEVRSINDVAGEIRSGAEFAAARSLLEAAGARVTVEAPAPPPPEFDHLAGIIVREATTNIVRHSRARSCTIRLTASERTGEQNRRGHGADRLDSRGGGMVRLSISNDGVTSVAPTGASPGTGLASLTARVQAAGGRLTTARTGGTFILTAELPVQGARVRSAGATSNGAAGTVPAPGHVPAWRA